MIKGAAARPDAPLLAEFLGDSLAFKTTPVQVEAVARVESVVWAELQGMLVPKVFSQAATSICWAGSERKIPGLLTNKVTVPKAFSASLKSFLI